MQNNKANFLANVQSTTAEKQAEIPKKLNELRELSMELQSITADVFTRLSPVLKEIAPLCGEEATQKTAACPFGQTLDDIIERLRLNMFALQQILDRCEV